MRARGPTLGRAWLASLAAFYSGAFLTFPSFLCLSFFSLAFLLFLTSPFFSLPFLLFNLLFLSFHLALWHGLRVFAFEDEDEEDWPGAGGRLQAFARKRNSQ